METIDNRPFKEKVETWWINVQWRTRQKAYAVGKFVKAHPVESIAVATTVIGVTGKAVASGNRKRADKIEEKRRDRDCYDPRTGEHYIARRKLTNDERLELERRYKDGESKGEILRDMGLY